ncbi:MAG: LysR substrate-binding domain-containing protein [Pseudomonadota bacterium]|nr:LysR substrate-binding domain-containing protein [Pseudomonadota bacterium]
MPVAPLRPKGPPLNAMRAFETAARRESFVAAAEELGVTPGAVSQQVKSLEDWAGSALFRRHAQGVTLTEAGQALLPTFVAAFDALGAATQALRSIRPVQELHIAALPCVAQLWLPARLERLRATFPALKISVTAMETPPNLNRELFDLALFYYPADDAPSHALPLAQDRIFPVCAPCIAARLTQVADINGQVLLQDQTWAQDWVIWSREAAVSIQDPEKGPQYSLYSLALQEAVAGAGVLMGHETLVADALEEGRLVRPFATPVADTGRALMLTQPPHGRRGPDLGAVVDQLCRS